MFPRILASLGTFGKSLGRSWDLDGLKSEDEREDEIAETHVHGSLIGAVPASITTTNHSICLASYRLAGVGVYLRTDTMTSKVRKANKVCLAQLAILWQHFPSHR